MAHTNSQEDQDYLPQSIHYQAWRWGRYSADVMEDRSAQLQRQVHELRQMLAERDQQQQRQKPGINPGYLSDEQIVGRWSGLKERIKGLVEEYIDVDPESQTGSESSSRWGSLLSRFTGGRWKKGKRAPTGLRAELGNLLRKGDGDGNSLDGLLAEKAGRSLLAQAVIWNALARKIFASREFPEGRVWDWGVCDSEGVLQTGNESFTASSTGTTGYHAWRSSTAAFLGSLAAVREKVDGRADGVVTAHMEPALSFLLRGWNPEAVKQTAEIVREAARLQTDIGRQRAWWLCELPCVKSDTPFDVDEMEMDGSLPASGSGDGPVDLVLVPALVKVGDDNGEDYTGRLVVDKSLVVCGLHPTTATTSWEGETEKEEEEEEQTVEVRRGPRSRREIRLAQRQRAMSSLPVVLEGFVSGSSGGLHGERKGLSSRAESTADDEGASVLKRRVEVPRRKRRIIRIFACVS